MLDLFLLKISKPSSMNILKGIKLLLIFLLVLHTTLYAQHPSNPDAFEKLLAFGEKEQEQGRFTEALAYYLKAETLAINEKKSKTALLSVKISIAEVFGSSSNFRESLGYYQQALDLAATSGAQDQLATILNNIGLLYTWQHDTQPALQYFERAYKVANQHKLAGSIRSEVAVNLAQLYNSTGQYQKSQRYLAEVQPLEKTAAIEQMWKTNYAEALMLEGKVAAAQTMAEQLYKEDTIKCHACITDLLSRIYERQNKLDLAVSFAKKGLTHTSALRDRIKLYDQLSGLYRRNNQYRNSLLYRDSIIILKDSLSKVVKNSFSAVSRFKLGEKDYQNAIIVTSKKQVFERKIYIISLVFGIIAILILYHQFKNRFLKGKRENIILENKRRISELELEKLKNSISEKNKEISAKALYTSGRNELIEKTLELLKNTSLRSSNESVNNYSSILKSYVKKEEEENELFEHFEKVNPGFLNALKLRHPDLSSNDIRFVSYVYMGLSMDEISGILRITTNACRVRKNRILEKMGQNKENSLFDYVMTIE